MTSAVNLGAGACPTRKSSVVRMKKGGKVKSGGKICPDIVKTPTTPKSQKVVRERVDKC